MAEQHECVWEEYRAPNYDPPPYIRCKHCKESMDINEVLRRLNEYETLKKATEVLSVEISGLEETIVLAEMNIKRWSEMYDELTRQYDTLKKATKALSAEDATGLANLCMSMQGKAIHSKGSPLSRKKAQDFWRDLVVRLQAYADTREGKNDQEENTNQ